MFPSSFSACGYSVQQSEVEECMRVVDDALGHVADEKVPEVVELAGESGSCEMTNVEFVRSCCMMRDLYVIVRRTAAD